MGSRCCGMLKGISAFLILMILSLGWAIAQDRPPAVETDEQPTPEAAPVTEEQPAEVAPPPVEEKKPEPKTSLPCAGGEYLCGKGFSWKTEDGEYSLRIGGRFQFHWILDNYDIHRATRLENNAEFGVPRAYLFVSGNAFKDFEYALNYRIDKGIFDDWTVTWTPPNKSGRYSFTMGRFKPSFSREFLTSSGGLSLVNRNLADAQFRIDRDYGVDMTAYLIEKKLKADIGFFNGLADSSTDNTNSRLTARLQLDLNSPPSSQGDLSPSQSPRLSVGLAGSMENDVYDFDGNGEYDDNAVRWTADCAFYWQGLNVVGAYFGRVEQNQKTTGPGDPNEKNRNSLGYSLQGSFFVVPGKVELVAMMSYIVPDTDDPRARKGASGWRHEQRFGVGYYIDGHSLKIQADYGTVRQREAHGSLDDNQVRVQFTINF
jgi:phosphate-selective porin OprO/OprP